MSKAPKVVSQDPVVKVLKLFKELDELHESGVDINGIVLPDDFDYLKVGDIGLIRTKKLDDIAKFIKMIKVASRRRNTKLPNLKRKSKVNALDQMLKTEQVTEFLDTSKIPMKVAADLIKLLTRKPPSTTTKKTIFMEVAATLKRFADKDEFKKPILTYGEIAAKYNAVVKATTKDTKAVCMDSTLFRRLLGKKTLESITMEAKARITYKSFATSLGRKPTAEEWDNVQWEIARMMRYSGRMTWSEFKMNPKVIAFVQSNMLTFNKLFGMYNNTWNEVSLFLFGLLWCYNLLRILRRLALSPSTSRANSRTAISSRNKRRWCRGDEK